MSSALDRGCPVYPQKPAYSREGETENPHFVGDTQNLVLLDLYLCAIEQGLTCNLLGSKVNSAGDFILSSFDPLSFFVLTVPLEGYLIFYSLFLSFPPSPVSIPIQ